MSGKTTDLNTVCPHCSKKMDATTSVNNYRSPTPGALAICAYCTEICQYDEQLQLKPLPDEVWDSIPEQQQQQLRTCQQLLKNAADEARERERCRSALLN